MANVDELSIQIEASSEDAAKAIDTLVKGLENLNTALGNLDADKVSKFASAVSKLSSIGSSTNITAKAIKDMANDIAGSFGIKTKKGIDDIVTSLQALYTTSRNLNLNDSLENQNAFENSRKSLQKAIEDNYRYVISVDERTKAIKEYVKAQNKSGSKIAMGDMAAEFGEDFENISKVLGKSFKNKLFDTEATSLEQFFKDMNHALNTSFKTGNDPELKQSVEDLVDILKNADDEVYKFGDVVSKGMLTGEEAADKTYVVIDKLFSLIKEQDKYSASSGLSGLADVFDRIGNVHVPDMAGVADAIKAMSANPPVQTAKAVGDIGNAASKASKEVDNLTGKLSNIQRVIEGNEIKDYERGFTMKDSEPIQNVEYPPAVIEQAEVYREKLLPAVIDTENQIDNLYRKMMSMSSTEAVYDMLTQKFIEMKTQLMEMSGAIGGNKWATDSPVLALPEFEKQLPAVTRYSDAIRSLFEKDLGIDNVSQMLNKVNAKVEDVGTTALALPEQFKTSTDYINKCLEEVGEQKGFENVAKQAAQAQSAIEKALQALRDYKQTLSDMESGKIPFDKDIYDNAVIGYAKATEEIKKYKDDLLGVEDNSKKAVSGDILSNIVALGDALKKVSDQFGSLADKGISIFKVLTKPLQMAANEYVEKFDNIGKTIQNFRKKFNAEMTKMSQFWKRTMKTFTFMLVRKAIDAIVKEVGTAIQSLAMYSNAMGTAFNTDLSNMVADFQYLGRSIVSIFAPLLNAVIPIIDAIVDRIATLLSYIGMLFAALGGSTSFTKAKKIVGNYAESLDSASKSAKNLTMGIDELNILSESSGGGSAKPYDGWEDAWEDVEIPDWITDLADKLKGIFSDLFEPIKNAWEKAKQYVLDGWKYMTEQMKLLLADVWRDFMKVWQSETVEHIFYQFFMIIGDLERVIGNLAKRFREAWNDADAGYNILMNLATIFDVLITHVRNVTEYMIKWSDGITFIPLIHSVETLTFGFIKLADFLGGVFEDVMKNVVLKYIEWMIEIGIPHLLHTINELIAAFNFTKIREDLIPLEKAFERLAENIHTGVTDAIGNLGKKIAEFTNSDEFTKFLQRLADIMDLLGHEDVEKILTGIGLGILHIADAVVKFINSDTFMAFLESLDKWLKNASAEDIAGVLEKLAWAIGLFKFAQFATAGLAGFFQFAVILKSFQNLGSIATNLGKVATKLGAVGTSGAAAATGASGASSGFAALMTAALPIVVIITAIVAGVYSLITSFGGLDGFLTRIREGFERVNEKVAAFAKLLGIDILVQQLKDAISRLGEKLSSLRDFWDLVLSATEKFAVFMASPLVFAFGLVVGAITVVIDIVATLVDVLGGVGTMIKGVFDGDWEEVKSGASRVGNAIVEGVKTGISRLKGEVSAETTNGINEGMATVPEGVEETVRQSSKTISGFFSSSYAEAGAETGILFRDTTLGVVNQGLDAVNSADYNAAGNVFANSQYQAYQSSISALDFSSLGVEWNTKSSEALMNSGTLFSTANETTSSEGASTFSQTYMDYITQQSLMGEGLNQYGVESGTQMVTGLNSGLTDNMQTTTASIDEWMKLVDTSITNNGVMPFSGTVNTKMQEYGKGMVTSFNLGVTTNASTTITAVSTWFTYFSAAMKSKLEEVKTTFNTMLTNIFSGAGWDYNSPITTLFTNVTMSITNNLAILGDNLLNNLLPMFMETYILPFFSIDRWQPLFDVLLNEVFMTSFTQFTEWFNTSMTTWWNEYLLIWFQPAKWNSEVFLPLQKNREQRYKLFIDWWVKSLKSWWEEKTMPYFKPTFWDEKVYIPLQKNREKHYKEFIDWWDKSLKDWWDNKTMPYFKDSFWDDEIYTPIKNNLHKHFEAFIKWWDETLEDWWNNHTKPYFEEELWRKLFTTVLDVSEDVFEKVKDAIQERIKDAAQSVADACSEMTSSLNDVLSLIGEVTEALKGFGDLGGAVTFNYSGEFATGGFPSAGSLFLAGETGAGAEFVGNIGGRTGVVSNGEITGIADAVYSTGNQESVLLAQLISLTQALLDKDPVVIGDKEIAEMANNGQSQLGMSIIN